MTSAGEPSTPTAADLDEHLRVLRTATVGRRADEAVIRDAADRYLGFLPASGRDAVVARWLADQVTLEPATVLRREGGPRAWYTDQNHDSSTGYHWSRLRDYLVTVKNRPETVLDALDTTTDQILEMMEDPGPNGPTRFQVRGLVVGYVQSGKTANFSALIAKSFDAGYRVVIVLSGLHNTLRRQTQLRLEDELGLVASTSGHPRVGLAEEGQQITRMTRSDIKGDFNQGTADANLLTSGARTILVMKKNASVLRRLDEWLKTLPPITAPVLVIDDEADQASINTGGNRSADEPVDPDEEDTLDQITDLSAADVDAAGPGGIGQLSRAAQADETNPSVINGLIRGLLNRMRRAVYIGYTATPFANVLIGHDWQDREVGEDLYPGDFIVSLPEPPGYVGAERLFGRAALGAETDDISGLDVIRTVPDHEARGLLPRSKEPDPTGLPESLKNALMDFLLATAARDVRTGGEPATSMLIHASQLTDRQDVLAGLVREQLALLRTQWRYDLPQPGFREQLRKRWETEFIPVTEAVEPTRVIPFGQLENSLQALFRRRMPVLVLNNRSQDDLDYESDPNLRAVIIGGNKLSRGLTLEGLLVSYYVRRANAYDTLLQMGRWFGYRQDYADLTRLHTTVGLADNFRDLATCEEELRNEIRLYEQLKLTPRDFGPRIRKHPAMEITARSRMGSARTVAYNYARTLQQTSAFDLGDPDWLERNLAATRRFLSGLGAGPDNYLSKGAGRRTWTHVDWRSVHGFLGEYETATGSTRFIAGRVRRYLWDQAVEHGELVRWTVSIRGLLIVDEALGDVDLHITDGGSVACINRSREKASLTSIGTLVNPVSAGGRGDEDIDLSDDDRARAREVAQGQKGLYPLELRSQRDARNGAAANLPHQSGERPRPPRRRRRRR